jgi:hypothetical protein
MSYHDHYQQGDADWWQLQDQDEEWQIEQVERMNEQITRDRCWGTYREEGAIHIPVMGVGSRSIDRESSPSDMGDQEIPDDCKKR